VSWSLLEARERDKRAEPAKRLASPHLAASPDEVARAMQDREQLLALLDRVLAAAANLADAGDDLLALCQHEPGCPDGGISGLRCDCRLPTACGAWEKALSQLVEAGQGA